MIETKNRWKSIRDRERWAVRGATFVGKVKATKVVWFPPKPVETGKEAVSTVEEETTRAAKKSSGAAKKATGTAKRKTGSAKKATGGSRRQKKTGETKDD